MVARDKYDDRLKIRLKQKQNLQNFDTVEDWYSQRWPKTLRNYFN